MSEVTDRKVTTLRLCNRCAKAWFNDQVITPDQKTAEPAEMLKNMLEMLVNPPAAPKQPTARIPPKIEKTPPCPTCGATLEMIAKEGHLGCLDCYAHFGSQKLASLLRPKEVKEEEKQGRSLPNSLEEYGNQLSFALSEAVEKEQYEQAALLKEKLKMLSLVKQERDKLEEKLSAAVRAGQFEDAKAIKQTIETMVSKFLNQ